MSQNSYRVSEVTSP